MTGYITRKGGCWYYEGLDPATGRERRRWHAAGTDRAAAEALKRQFAAAEHERRGTGRSRLTLAGHVERTWLPRKQRQLRQPPSTATASSCASTSYPPSATCRCGRCGSITSKASTISC